MIVAVPSKGRAGKVKTLKVLSSAILYVPAYEVDSYRTMHPATAVVGVPATVIGITATRNWILETADDPDVVMVDDDVKVAGYIELQDEIAIHRKLPEAVWLAECARLFAVTRGLGYRLWGVATQDAPRSVYPYRPLVFRTYVTASFCGICNETGIRFDPAFAVKEDYELCLRCLVEDGGVVGARYLYWANHHWDDPGGCAEYRTRALEADAIARLQRMYPGMVKQITRGGGDYAIELTV